MLMSSLQINVLGHVEPRQSAMRELVVGGVPPQRARTPQGAIRIILVFFR